MPTLALQYCFVLEFFFLSNFISIFEPGVCLKEFCVLGKKQIEDIKCKVFLLCDKYLQFDATANTLEGKMKRY